MNKDVEHQSHSHYIIGTMLLIAGLLIIMVFVLLKSQADDTTTSVTISNATPTVDSFTLATSTAYTDVSGGGITNLLEGPATTTFYIKGQFTDNNGCQDVYSIASGAGYLEGAIYYQDNGGCLDANAGTALALQNARYCYNDAVTDTSGDYASGENAYTKCVVTGCTDNTDPTADYLCTFHMRHFASSSAPAGVWKASIGLYDGTVFATQTRDFEIATLTALEVSSTLDFGSVAVGVSTTEVVTNIINQGNKNDLSSYIAGTKFTCTIGSFATSSIRYATSSPSRQFGTYGLSEAPSAAKVTTTDDPIITTGVTVSRQSVTSTLSTSTIYLQIMPPTVANNGNTTYQGTCSATLTFTGY